MKFPLKKISPLKFLINFFASIYDLIDNIVSPPLKILIIFFAGLYDLVYGFVSFLVEYVIWITNIRSTKSTAVLTKEEKSTQANQNPF